MKTIKLSILLSFGSLCLMAQYPNNIYLTDPNTNSGSGTKLILGSGSQSGNYHSIGINNYWTEFRSHTNEGWKFITGNTSETKLVVEGNGKVGIGTTSPTASLSLKGLANNRVLDGYGKSGNLMMMVNTTGGWPHFILYDNATSGTPLVHLNTNGNSFLNGGNVGIGTTNPDQLLTISEDDNPVLRLERSGTNKHNWEIYSQSGGSLFFRGGANAVGTSLTNFLAIQSNGNVGIGTTTPESKLAVDGKIRATEVKILTDVNSVPDYVFEADYELRTLQETKEYITKYKHLPEIPSATEIGENGIDLGDMNMRLLKKIEELTLHLIEQNERMEKMEKELHALKD
ncbi:MAG: hypothetical protein ABJG78_13160 [Cyclobacteriaceae bacterium]